MTADEEKKQPAPSVDEERETLQKAVTALERENKTLQGRISSMDPQIIEELRVRNKELKANLLEVEKALALELLGRKTPIDAAGCTDKLQVLKTEVLGYCVDRKIEQPLWKKLESL